VKDSIVNAFSGAFQAIKERRQRNREKKMIDHLKKIKEGIGFLVKGDKIDALTKPKKKKAGFIDKLLNFLGLAGAGGLMASIGVGAIIAFLGVMIGNAIRKAIKGWFEGGAEGASKGFLMGITDIPRTIVAWIAGLFGADKLAEAMSDESMSGFIDDMNAGIQQFMEDVTNWFSDTWTTLSNSLIRMWNAGIDAIPLIPESMKNKLKGFVTSQAEIDKLRSEQKDVTDLISSPGGTKAEVESNINQAITRREHAIATAKAFMEEGGASQAKLMKKMGEEIKMLRDAAEKLVDAAPAQYENSQIYGMGSIPYPINAGREIDKVPTTDSTMNMKNNNYHRSDKNR
jgi:hypothetical protein